MVDAADELDSQLAALVERLEAEGLPQWHSLSPDGARRLEEDVFAAGDGPEVGTVRQLRIDGPAGELAVRTYRPRAADLPAGVETPPTLVFYHGGGWVTGTLDSCDDICRELAARSGSLVLSVDYRLAPEHPFPAGLDDAYAALEWAADYAADLGGDPSRLGVAGTSAGGNLAAAVALRARGADAPALDGQFLLYPVLDDRMAGDSYRDHADGPLLTRADMAWFWEQYCRSPVDAHNPFAAPARAPELSGVAPATVVTAGFDVLRDEGVAYADRLDATGVAVDHLHYPALAHGFLSLTDEVDRADAAADEVAASIRSRLG